MSTDCDNNTPDVNVTVFRKYKYFPPIVNEKIDTEDFLESAAGIVAIVDKLGTLFSPVKYDMSGNIEKLRKCLDSNKNKYATLHDLVLNENMSEAPKVGTEALLWLTRAIYFVEIFLFKLVERSSDKSESIKHELIYAYELTLKKYHNWVTQRLFKLICQMCPSKSHLYKSMDVTDIKIFVEDASKYLDFLKSNRMEINNLYKMYNMEN